MHLPNVYRGITTTNGMPTVQCEYVGHMGLGAIELHAQRREHRVINETGRVGSELDRWAWRRGWGDNRMKWQNIGG